MLRLIGLVRRAAGITKADFARFRLDELGPLVAGLQSALRICRYVQTHRTSLSASVEAGFLTVRPGVTHSFDGIEEYWWADHDACAAALAPSARYFAELVRACGGWIDFAASPFWLGVEYPQVAAAPGTLIAAPRSGLARLVFAFAPVPGLSCTAAQHYWLHRHAPLVRRWARARGTLAYTQVHRLLGDGPGSPVPTLGIAPPHAWIGHAEAWFAEAPPPPGEDRSAAMLAAIIDEQNFIDWTSGTVLSGQEFTFVDRVWD